MVPHRIFSDDVSCSSGCFHVFQVAKALGKWPSLGPRMKISTPMGESGLIFPTLRCAPVQETGRCLYSWPVLIFLGEGGGRRLLIIHVTQGRVFFVQVWSITFHDHQSRIQATSGSVDLRSPVRIFFGWGWRCSNFRKTKANEIHQLLDFPAFCFAVSISIHRFLSRFSRCEEEKTPSFTHHLLYMKWPQFLEFTGCIVPVPVHRLWVSPGTWDHWSQWKLRISLHSVTSRLVHRDPHNEWISQSLQRMET